MKGIMLIYEPNRKRPIARALTATPTLEELRAAIGGGYLELVPGFLTAMWMDKFYRCIALCDEDGKRKKMPVNGPATIEWDFALRQNGGGGLRGLEVGRPVDYLVGPVLVIMGDAELMESL